MKKTIFLFFLFICLVGFNLAQEKASLNSWRGLTLDVSTPTEAIEKLGPPVKDKPKETFLPLVYSKWFGNDVLKFRRLTFKNIEGFDEANLYFANDKLVIIELDLKKDLAAAALVDAYDAKFYPLVGNYENGITPNDLAEGKREIIYPKYFPSIYKMAAANESAIGMAYASQGFAESLAAGLSQRSGAVSNALSGLVRKLQLISRALENKKGVDLLK
jgi:hypothetical protein